jgi:alginate O-acetyltransferase complex protein AlgI
VLFPTIEFWVFFAIVFAAFWALADRERGWKVLLLVASYVFYAWWDVRFVLLLAAATVINFAGSRAIVGSGGRAAKLALAATIGADLALLGWFKYYGFVSVNAAGAFASLGLGSPLPLVQVTLPVGISFFTFMGISYVADVYRRVVAPAGALDFAVYLAFFPHLVAGPIVRGAELLPQLAQRAREREVDFPRAATLIVGGLLKKVVLSTFLATSVVDPAFALPSAHAGADTLLAVYAYAVQIWADFSGYTDIAIGVALLLGFRFPDNFDAPYAATSLRDFWRRWHMTLSRWLRDYLYIPLGGSRSGGILTARNLLITMILGGLWHGAAWTFIAWGALHGVGQVLERAVRTHVDLPSTWLTRSAGRLVTFHVVCLGWILFRSDSLASARDLIAGLGHWGMRTELVTPTAVLAVALALLYQLMPRSLPGSVTALFARLDPVPQGALIGAGIAGITYLGPSGVPPFIYYRF